MEEKYRSHFLYEQIRAFEDKVYSCYEQFNIDMLHRMFVDLTKKTVVDVRKVKTIAHLRKCFKDLNRTLRCKYRNRKVKATPEEEKLVKYFTWFFQYLDYLKELRTNFTDRIYQPLFRYFYHIGYDKPDREDSNDSGISTPSIVSFQSIDSGYSGFSGLTSFLGDPDISHSYQSARTLSRSVSRSNSDTDFEETQNARRNAVTKHALVLLGREYKDIRRLYDTSDIQRIAKRMCHLKGRIDHLTDKENSLDNELLSQDSERVVFHLKILDSGTLKLMRLVPDILMKFQKQAWLARRWLEKDDEKTKDLNAKLDKLTSLEEQMNKRLSSLSQEIQQKEKELESQSDVLNKFLEREERSNNLSQDIFDLRRRREVLKEQMDVFQKERNKLCKQLHEAVKSENKTALRELKPLYDRNKLQRFALERQLAGLEYHLSLLESDMTIELEVKADIIHTTNDVQDRCEEIESFIEKAKKEQKAIQAALIPISQDKRFVKEQIQIKDRLPLVEAKHGMTAEFVGSSIKTPDRIVDLNEEYLGLSKNKNAVSLFLTGLPSEESGHVTPIEKPIKNLMVAGREQSRQVIPDLMDSEW